MDSFVDVFTRRGLIASRAEETQSRSWVEKIDPQRGFRRGHSHTESAR